MDLVAMKLAKNGHIFKNDSHPLWSENYGIEGDVDANPVGGG